MKKKKKNVPELETQHLEPLSVVVLGVDSGGASGGVIGHIVTVTDAFGRIEVVVNAFGCVTSLSWCW